MSDNVIDLVILRHGEADNAIPDNQRRLTIEGRKQITKQCKWLKRQGFNPELILHSPYIRTTETAELAQLVFTDTPLDVEPLLTPDGDPERVAVLISALEKNQILVASHMPLVTYLTECFLSSGEMFGYPVAGLCWLQLSPETASKAKLLHKHWPS